MKNSGQNWYWTSRPKTPEGLRRDFGGPERYEPPSDLEVRRTIAPGQMVALRPFALARPFVVMATKPVSVHPGEDAEFLVDLPVSVRWMASTGEVLAHPNTIELHKTWFGDTSSGRLCFLWRTTLEAPEVEPFGSMIRCRILVRNHAKAPLVLKQFPIYCEYLSIWETGDSLRCDVVLVEGLNDATLRMSTLKYEGAKEERLLYEAQITQGELLFQRGVDFLRSIAGIT
jgi:hypothetical protein